MNQPNSPAPPKQPKTDEKVEQNIPPPPIQIPKGMTSGQLGQALFLTPELLELLKIAVGGDRDMHHARIERFASRKYLYGLLDDLDLSSYQVAQRLEQFKSAIFKASRADFLGRAQDLEARLNRLDEATQRVSDQDQEEQKIFERRTIDQRKKSTRVMEILEDIFEQAGLIPQDRGNDSSRERVPPFDVAILREDPSLDVPEEPTGVQASTAHKQSPHIENYRVNEGSCWYMQPPTLYDTFPYGHEATGMNTADRQAEDFLSGLPNNIDSAAGIDEKGVTEWVQGVSADDAETNSEPDLEDWTAEDVGISDAISMVAGQEDGALIRAWRTKCEENKP